MYYNVLPPDFSSLRLHGYNCNRNRFVSFPQEFLSFQLPSEAIQDWRGIGIAYNWKNYFIGAQAQFNRLSYKKGECKVVLIDGYARLSLGMRL